ncbi:MAG TPA: HK97 family phage prohead protease [Acidimicrobiales bacterium]|jgi:phage head maturation protease|nr:HK97 family phage prohead protease [Acidimicrobiales bacterium]
MTEQLEEGYRADVATVAEITDLDGHQVVVDYPYQVLDGYRTDWARGCWRESFAKRLPVMLWNHNPDLLIGAGVRTEELGDRARVINRFADFDAVPQARAAHSMIEDKIVPGFSFHYRNGRSVVHPDVRGARRFVKADMLENSPVVFPSIPGAAAVGIRSQEAPTLDTPTIDEILRLRDQRILDDEGVRALVAEHYPTFREHIKIGTTVRPPEMTAEQRAAWVEKFTGEMAGSGLRDMVIHIGSDGTVTTGGVASDGDGGDDGDPATLASAVDAALDEAANLLDGFDVTSLPDNVQQALALVQAAGVAVDELLDVMGIDDPDQHDDGDGGRAMLSSKETDDLPDSVFGYIEPGGTKDASGKTMPRSKRHFPLPDAAHVRNALARAAQGAEFAKEAMPKITAAAKKFGVDTAGKRSDPEPEPASPEAQAAADAALDADLARVQDRLARLK